MNKKTAFIAAVKLYPNMVFSRVFNGISALAVAKFSKEAFA
jgi:hypothetical protein